MGTAQCVFFYRPRGVICLFFERPLDGFACIFCRNSDDYASAFSATCFTYLACEGKNGRMETIKNNKLTYDLRKL